MPIRCLTQRSQTLPLALIVKDSHLYPVSIEQIKVIIQFQNQAKKHFIHHLCLPFSQTINQDFFYTLFEIPIKAEYENQQIKIQVAFSYTTTDGQTHQAINDNYKGLAPHSFSCFISRDNLPFPSSYYKGDPHYHSSYTSDQVEFGAPLSITQRFAWCMGMDWFFVTDHSYDLDDYADNYLANDPALGKWYSQQEEIKQVDCPELRIIQGEEISIGNHQQQNVHLLAINHEFVPGKGDSAEKWFRNKPDLQMIEISKQPDPQNKRLLIAAHPFESVPFSQKLSLNRGNWSEKDIRDNQIDYIQAINQNTLFDCLKSVSQWKALLLKGIQSSLVAGNDAHGNFQFMKQIKIPFVKLFISKKQIFARFFTIFKYTENEPVEGFKTKHLLVSNGPFLDFQLKTSHLYSIGQTISEETAILIYQVNSNLEFGKIALIKLFIGDIDKNKESCTLNPKNGELILLPERGYIRMECLTEKMAIAITNPVWINQPKKSLVL